MAKAVWRIINKNHATETDPKTKNVKTIMRLGSWEAQEPGNPGAGQTEPGSWEAGDARSLRAGGPGS